MPDIFTAGTRVRILRMRQGMPPILKYRFGVVVLGNDAPLPGYFRVVGVSFAPWDGGHDCTGLVDDKSGWLFNAEDLERTAWQDKPKGKAFAAAG